jgi:hypothetical protein
MKKVLFLLSLFFVLSAVNAFPIGVITPETVCVKPDSTGTIAFDSQSQSGNYEMFKSKILGVEWVTLDESELFLPPESSTNVKAKIDTSGVTEGVYKGIYEFCYINSETKPQQIIPCVQTDFSINVSNGCVEKTEPVVEQIKTIPVQNFASPILWFIPIFLGLFVLVIILFALLKR